VAMSVIVPTVAALATLLLPAAAARADDGDDNYLWELNSFGLTPATLRLPDVAREIALGHAICTDLATTSQDPNDTVTALLRNRPNLSRSDMESLVTAAVTNYCGDVGSRPLPWADPCLGGPAHVDQQGAYRCGS
jgi:Protein of unknown function (DUF732)